MTENKYSDIFILSLEVGIQNKKIFFFNHREPLLEVKTINFYQQLLLSNSWFFLISKKLTD